MESEEQTDDTTEELITEFLEVQPTQAFEYDVLTITGEHIDTTATYTVTINDTEATVIDITETSLEVQIAEGTEDGPLRIELGTNEVQLDQIDILKTEEAKVYGVKHDGQTQFDYIIEIDMNTGKTLDTLLAVPNSQYQIDEIEYYKAENTLVMMGYSNLATFNLNTNVFTTLPSTITHGGFGLTIGENARVFTYAFFSTAIWELDFQTGEIIGDGFYEPEPWGLYISGMYYAETENKLLVYEYVEETPISSAYTIEKIYNFDDNTITTGAVGLHKNVHVNENEMYASRDLLIGKRSVGESIQNPVEMPVNATSKLRYSNSSNRIFFYHSDSQNGYIDYLYRFHIPTQSFNNVAIEEDINHIVITN